jgi:DNA-binding LacI/PurR family transcriptional regulator
MELPSTIELAELWKTSKSTAHTALNNLVKEGLLERRHGSGTHVRVRPPSLDRMGIYFSSPNIWTDEEMTFYRNVQGLLEKNLAKLGIEITVFVDRRPEGKQRVVLPELRKAIETQQIQGLIIPIANSVNLSALLKLPVPSSVFTAAIGVSNKLGFDNKKYFQEVLSRLAAKGCRSVGIISSADSLAHVRLSSEAMFFTDDFRREVEVQGMVTREEWVRIPQTHTTDRSAFGYEEFHRLWRQPSHPDAVIVFPDVVVRGVVTAALELGVHNSQDVVFCFHRNARSQILCPFPALWVISDEESAAEALIDLVRRQHAGKKISPVRLPFLFKDIPRTVAAPL